jgi:HEAT repeat protein
MSGEGQIGKLIELLDSERLEKRLMAIHALGEVGDEGALRALRERLEPANQELTALIMALGMLKRKLGVK